MTNKIGTMWCQKNYLELKEKGLFILNSGIFKNNVLKIKNIQKTA